MAIIIQNSQNGNIKLTMERPQRFIVLKNNINHLDFMLGERQSFKIPREASHEGGVEDEGWTMPHWSTERDVQQWLCLLLGPKEVRCEPPSQANISATVRGEKEAALPGVIFKTSAGV